MIRYLSERKSWLAAAVILTAAALRLLCLGSFAYFIDEIHAIRFGGGSLIHAMRMLGETPGTAPLDYSLVNVLSHVSTSEWFMRLPYALAGIWAVYLTYRLASRWFGQRQGLVVSGLMAISTAHIYYSQSIRCYSLGVLLLILIVDSYERVFIEGEIEAARRFAAFCALAVLNQFFALIPIGFLFAHGFAAAGAGRGRESGAAAKMKALAVTAAVLAVIVVADWRLILSPKSLGVLKDTLPAAIRIVEVFKVFGMLVSLQSAGIGIIFLFLFIFGIFHMARHHKPRAALIALMAIAPVPLIVIQEARMNTSVQLRHIVFALPFYLMSCAEGLEWLCGRLSRLKKRRGPARGLQARRSLAVALQLAACALILYALAPSVKAYYTDPYRFNGGEADLRLDLKSPAEKIAEITGKDSILVATGIAHGPWRYSMDFYLGRLGQPRQWLTFPDIENTDDTALRGRSVRFVYFDFPYFYNRDFTNASARFKAFRLNSFITLFEPAAPVRTRKDLIETTEAFLLMIAPPTDFRIYSDVYTNLGVVARMNGDYARAAEMGERAVAVSEHGLMNVLFDEVAAREQLGETYFLTDRPQKALEQWNVAASLLPKKLSIALLTQLGYHPERLYTDFAGFYERSGDYEHATENVKTALAYNAGYRPALAIQERIRARK